MSTHAPRILLTRPRFCTALRISRQHFYRLVREGQLRAVRLGSRDGASIRVPAAELERFLTTDEER
jgi:excisionase family DNA binding protein